MVLLTFGVQRIDTFTKIYMQKYLFDLFFDVIVQNAFDVSIALFRTNKKKKIKMNLILSYISIKMG